MASNRFWGVGCEGKASPASQCLLQSRDYWLVFINIPDDQKLQARSKTLVREGCTKKAWSFTKLPSDPHPFPLGLFFFFGKAKYCHVFGHYAISCYFWPFIRPKKGLVLSSETLPSGLARDHNFPHFFVHPTFIHWLQVRAQQSSASTLWPTFSTSRILSMDFHIRSNPAW